MKLFVPAVGFRIVLTQDWKFDVYHEHRNKSLLETAKIDVRGWYSSYEELAPGAPAWPRKMKRTEWNLHAGTMLEVDRVYVRSNSKGATNKDEDYDSLTFRIIDPKTLKGKVRFWAKLADVNNIEYELPANFTAAKDEAYAKARAPKKLKPRDIPHAVIEACRAYMELSGKVPDWMTVDLVQQFKVVSDEHNRQMDPYNRRVFDANQERELTELKFQILTGHLSVPLAQAELIRSIEDYKRHYPNDYRFQPWVPNERVQRWSYVVPHVLLSYYALVSTFGRDAGGNPVRTYRHRDGQQRDPNYPKFNHIWIKITTNKDDTEVLGVEAGFDPLQESA
jgi:hypothetical protein